MPPPPLPPTPTHLLTLPVAPSINTLWMHLPSPLIPPIEGEKGLHSPWIPVQMQAIKTQQMLHSCQVNQDDSYAFLSLQVIKGHDKDKVLKILKSTATLVQMVIINTVSLMKFSSGCFKEILIYTSSQRFNSMTQKNISQSLNQLIYCTHSVSSWNNVYSVSYGVIFHTHLIRVWFMAFRFSGLFISTCSTFSAGCVTSRVSNLYLSSVDMFLPGWLLLSFTAHDKATGLDFEPKLHFANKPLFSAKETGKITKGWIFQTTYAHVIGSASWRSTPGLTRGIHYVREYRGVEWVLCPCNRGHPRDCFRISELGGEICNIVESARTTTMRISRGYLVVRKFWQEHFVSPLWDGPRSRLRRKSKKKNVTQPGGILQV